MAIIEEPVLVVTNRRVGGMYKKLGYEPFEVDGKTVKVMVNSLDVFANAQVTVRVACDYCNKVYEVPKNLYTASITKTCTNKWACKECYGEKIKESSRAIYGCDSASCTEETKQKKRETNKKRFGVEYASQNADIKEKVKKTFMERYGKESILQVESVKEKIRQTNLKNLGVEYPMQSAECVEKSKATCLERYGVEHYTELDECKAKIKETCIDRYNVEAPMQSDEIKKKSNESLYAHGTCKTSKQQSHIWEVVGGLLNYPFETYNLDILLDDIDIEYNGSGHNLCVVTGKVEEERFNKREAVRKEKIKNSGMKILNLNSATDKLPSDETILKYVDIAKESFATSDIKEITIDLDKNTIVFA